MNGIHDLGGVDGFGSIDADATEPFREEWERYVFAVQLLTSCQGLYNRDEFRCAIERIPPPDYLESGYFERWLTAVETLLVEKGVIDADALSERVTEISEPSVDGFENLPECVDSDLTEHIRRAIEEGFGAEREPREPQFAVGDTIRVRNRHPSGHTRCPRYVRRAEGTIESIHGTHALPDENARGEGVTEPLYSVRFDLKELWGPEAEANGSLSIDLWESYLEPPEGSDRQREGLGAERGRHD